uniref:Uncharacterized protein n=1 Tax=Coccolithus braarudii TaxID=221442 RepID=A0A7S0LLN5_9EUKA|mmetsp:Transcript_47281/g.100926  ORF Transcript_47281/g.100926 Transcript_47281/m.100926 type:complete len:417 (+) Transcript_47281:182-1432(+)
MLVFLMMVVRPLLASIESAPEACVGAKCVRIHCSCLLHGRHVSWPNELVSRRSPIVTLGSPPRPRLGPAEEHAISSHFNLSSRGIYPGDVFGFQMTTLLSPEQRWTAYNLCQVSAELVLINVKATTLGLEGVAKTSVLLLRVRAQRSSNEQAQVVHELRNAEDARAVTVNGTAYALFVRYLKWQKKEMWLLELQPPYKETRVALEGAAFGKRSEGNWLPFVHGDQIFALYSLCPQRVLLIDPATARARVAYERTQPMPDCALNLSKTKLALRGSASGVVVPAIRGVVGLGHTKSLRPGRMYHHFFFRRDRSPPFAVRALSRSFRFPLFLIPHGATGRSDHAVQFSLDLQLSGQGVRGDHALSIDFSADDTYPLTTTVPIKTLCNFTGWCEKKPRQREDEESRGTPQPRPDASGAGS